MFLCQELVDPEKDTSKLRMLASAEPFASLSMGTLVAAT